MIDVAPRRPGVINLAILDQGEVWYDLQGERHVIIEMSPGHRDNTAKMLLRRARPFARKLLLERALRGESSCSGDNRFDVLVWDMALNPDEWLRDTPLYRALTDGLDTPVMRARIKLERWHWKLLHG